MSTTAAFEASKVFAAQAKPSIFTILACQSYNDIGKPAFDHLFRYRLSIIIMVKQRGRRHKGVKKAKKIDLPCPMSEKQYSLPFLQQLPSLGPLKGFLS